MDENELVRQLREGDDKAAAFLVSLLGSKLVGYARDIAGDLSDTDRLLICDIAVETAIRRIDRYDSERGSLERWMRAFVRHAAMDWRRSHHRLEELRDDDRFNDEGTNEPDPLRERALLRVAEVVRTLSDTDQLIIGLRDQEGLSYAEIAGRLVVEESACRQRHLRAVRRLAHQLETDESIQAILRVPRTGSQ